MQSHPDDYSEGGSAEAALADGEATGPADGPAAPLRLDARAGAGQRLDRFLAGAIDGVSRTRIQRWIALGAVAVDGAPALPSRRLRGLESIEAWPLPTEAERSFEPDELPLAIVHEDEDLMVIDKPAGRVVHPAPATGAAR